MKSTSAVLDYIAESSYSEKYGARNMRRFIERNVEDEIANLIIDKFPTKLSAIGISVKNNKLKFEAI